MGRVAACCFDAYGTLLDIGSAVARCAGRVGGSAPALTALWRSKQLEYTWTRTLMGRYRDFRAVTEDALDHALAAHGLGDESLRAALLEAYRTLEAYPDVAGALEELRRAGMRCAVLSNGTQQMLADAIGAAGLAALVEEIVSVDEIGIYKPDPRVYALAAERLALAPEAIAFMSSNPWDAAGAASFGFRAVWVNRAGAPDEYGLRGAVAELPDLRGLPALVLAS